MDPGYTRARYELRREAELRLAEGHGRDAGATVPSVGDRRLLHELQVHQLELEMQQEELLQARTEAEAQAARYADLYEHAPVAHITLNGDFAITELNLLGAGLLGQGRGELVGRSFLGYVADADRPRFAAWLEGLDPADPVAALDVVLAAETGARSWVHLEAAAVAGAEAWRLAALDITARRRGELLLAARAELAQVSQTATLTELLQATLHRAEELTESCLSYFHCVDDDQEQVRLQAWSTNTLRGARNADEAGRRYPLGEAGVWAECVRYHRPVLHNHQARLPHHPGLPEGHAEVVRELVVPLTQHDKVQAILGVANKVTDYTQDDVLALAALEDIVVDLVARKRAEEALLASERLARSTLDALSAHVAIVDGAGTIVAVNSAWRQFAQDNSPALAALVEGADYLAVCDAAAGPGSEGASEFAAGIRAVLHGLQVDHSQEYPCHSATEQRWFMGRVTRFGSGSETRLVLAHENITARKQAEDSLRDSLQRQQALLHASPDMLLVLASDGAILDAQSGRPELLFAPLAQFPAAHLRDVLPAEVAQGALACIAEAHRTGQIVPYTYALDLRGEQRHFEGRLVPCEDGTCVAVVRDITQRQRAEADRDRLTVAIEQSEDTVVITDTEGTIQYVNPVFEQVTGYCKAEALGQNTRILKSGQHSAEFYGELWETIAGGNTWQGRLVNRRKDGTLFTEDATISPVRAASGAITNYVAVKRNVTAQLELEAQLVQAQKMESVGRLAGGVAHDFNNMLGVILGRAELALELVAQEDPLHEDLTEILKAGRSSADLTRQLLAFARKQTVVPRALDLNRTIAGMLSMLRRLIGDHIQLQWQPATDLWPIKVDPSQIDQILANLCVNARDAIAEVGSIGIATANCTLHEGGDLGPEAIVAGDYVRITVSDDGCGIEPDVLAHIFEPFFTTKGAGEGTGLGLSTVYGAVKQNGGMMRVQSVPGAGTTFSIYLPRHAGATSVEPEHAAVAVPRGKATILVVEDEPALLRLTARMLSQQGYEVVLASGPAEAIELAWQHEGEIQLLLTDVIMPELSGPDLLDSVLPRYPDLKHLFMSGCTADLLGRHGVLNEGVSFIQKPFSQAELLSFVQAVLSGPQRTSAASETPRREAG